MRRPKFIAKHGGKPLGLLGRIVAFAMQKETTSINRDTITVLDPKPNERVLDIGTGNGLSLQLLANRIGEGSIVGVDHSPVMCARAVNNNKTLTAEGGVSVKCAVSDNLPFETGSFDAVMSVHTIYFWQPIEPHLLEIARILRPGGRLALAFRSSSDPTTADFPSSVYTFRSTAEVEELTMSCGFEGCSLESRGDSVYILCAFRTKHLPRSS